MKCSTPVHHFSNEVCSGTARFRRERRVVSHSPQKGVSHTPLGHCHSQTMGRRTQNPALICVASHNLDNFSCTSEKKGAVVCLEEALVQLALGWCPMQYELINWSSGDLHYRPTATGHGIFQRTVGPFIFSNAATDMKSSSSSTSSVAPKDTSSCASGMGGDRRP